jgi:hypothetical protein
MVLNLEVRQLYFYLLVHTINLLHGWANQKEVIIRSVFTNHFSKNKKSSLLSELFNVIRLGLEPRTLSLKGRCSTS